MSLYVYLITTLILVRHTRQTPLEGLSQIIGQYSSFLLKDLQQTVHSLFDLDIVFLSNIMI
jgi:hypothetical protein